MSTNTNQQNAQSIAQSETTNISLLRNSVFAHDFAKDLTCSKKQEATIPEDPEPSKNHPTPCGIHWL